MLMAAANIISNGTPWNVNTGYYALKRLEVVGEETIPHGLAFSSDGTKAYIVGYGGDTIFQYTLTTAWDISTGSYASKSLSVAAQDTDPDFVAFSSDGTKAYIGGASGDTIFQYTLTTAWDISTGSYASKSLSVAAQEANMRGLAFSSDGTKAYIVGSSGVTIYQYTLTTAWDISTGSYASKSLSVSDAPLPRSLAVSSDGMTAFVLGDGFNAIYQYTLTTAWDISTGSYASKSLSVAAQDTTPRGLAFSSDGTKAYITGNVSIDVHQYNLT